MIFIYQIFGYIFIPIIKLNIYLRILNKKEDKKRYSERYGITSLKRPQGKLIWIHASSVGEFKSASLIINKIHKEFNILITTTTLTAANYAIDNFGDKIIHQYAPLDIQKWIDRFLERWNPSLVLWIESDLWPLTLKTLKEKSIKSILLNCRISPQSYKRWQYLKSFYQVITSTFDEIYAQSTLDKKRLEYLTKRKVNYIGNLKLASIEKYYDSKQLNNFKNKLNGSKVLMLASTHIGEEKIFLNYIKKYLLQYKKIKIIIAPRHPERSRSILKMLYKEKIISSIFDKSLDLKEDVFVINSFGNMSFYYSLSDIVILGGSFVRKGGHNPVEPANNNCVVLTGPHIYNWENVYLDMKKFNACNICNSINELDNYINNLFKNSDKLESLKTKAKKFAESNFYNFNELLLKIDNYFNIKS